MAGGGQQGTGFVILRHLAAQLVKCAHQGSSLCHANLAQPHAVHNAAILHCKKCRKGHCFVHLAEAGIHSSEAITLYKKSLEQSTWHEFHLSKRTSPDQETILAAEASGEDTSNMIGQKRAIVALSFSHCQPLNNTPHIKPGWYDKLKSTRVAVRGTRLIGHAYISNCLTHNHQDPRIVLRHGYVKPSRCG